MAMTGDFYQSQAALCAKAAELTDLPMLRQKYEAARAAWHALAIRETEIAEARAKRHSEEAARRTSAGGTPA